MFADNAEKECENDEEWQILLHTYKTNLQQWSKINRAMITLHINEEVSSEEAVTVERIDEAMHNAKQMYAEYEIAPCIQQRDTTLHESASYLKEICLTNPQGKFFYWKERRIHEESFGQLTDIPNYFGKAT